MPTETTEQTQFDRLVDALSQTMPDKIRMAHAVAVERNDITEAKRIIMRYVLQQLSHRIDTA